MPLPALLTKKIFYPMNKKLPLAKKKFGQHFLRSPQIIEKICGDYANQSQSIIEVGPGPGILTQYLCKLNKAICVIEVDKDMISGLEKWLDKNQIINQDALEIDWETLITKNNLPDPVWLVSNLPYNVASPLLIKFLQASSIKFMTLMFQKEVALKALAVNEKRKEEMSSLGVLTHTYFHIKELVKVPPGAFVPPPKVESMVLSFERKITPDISIDDFPEFERFLRKIFSERRKQLGHILKKILPDEKFQKIESNLSELNICKKDRTQALTLLQVQGLYKSLKEDFQI